MLRRKTDRTFSDADDEHIDGVRGGRALIKITRRAEEQEEQRTLRESYSDGTRLGRLYAEGAESARIYPLRAQTGGLGADLIIAELAEGAQKYY